MFVQTLSGPARLWFNALPSGSIDNFTDLRTQFLHHFGQQKKCSKHPLELHNIRQGRDETVKEFIERYKQESLTVADANESQRLVGFIRGIRTKQLYKELSKRPPPTLQMAFDWAEEFIRGEEAVQMRDHEPPAPDRQSRRDGGKPNTEGKRPWQIASEVRGRNDRKYSGFAPYERANCSKDAKRNTFTPITKTPREVLSTEDARYRFKPPRAMSKSTANKNMNEYCEFHCDKGHDTNDCIQLRKEIEAAIKTGELAHLVRDIKDKKGGKKKQESCMMVSGGCVKS
jgi:hypothetical protein